MKDGDVRPDDSLGSADRAVKYLLDRVQHDANLRWYMLHTQAYQLLLDAEAARRGMSPEAVELERRAWKGSGDPVADVERYRKLLDEHGIDY